MRLRHGWVSVLAAAGVLLGCMPLLMAQNEPDQPMGAELAGDGTTLTAPTAGAPAPALRAQPRRLRDFNIAGLENAVSLESLEQWDVAQIIEFLAYKGGLRNIVIGKGVAGLTSKLKFDNVPVGDALDVVLSVNKLAYEIKGGIITIMSDEEYQKINGVSFYDNTAVRTLNLKFADPARIVEMLKPIKSAIGTIVADSATATLVLIDTPPKIREMEAIVAQADIQTVTRVVPTETKTFRLQYASVEDVTEALNSILTPELGAVRADRRTKSLIVTDLSHKMRQIEDLVTVFDHRAKQVFIEAKIVEVDLNDEYRLGVNWEHFFEGINPRFSLGAALTPAVTGPGGGFTPPAGAGALTYRAIVNGFDLQAALAALKSVGETRILSNPHVAVMSDEEATIKVVRDVPYAEAQLESGTTNVVGERITFIEVGVKLSVRPRINDGGMISMAIKPEVSTVVGQYQAFRAVPVVQKAYAETSVMIKDGETILIAGMITNEKGSTQTGVPWLRRIPLIGLLFRAQSESSQTRETIVFMTPRVISGEEPVLLTRDLPKQPKPLRSVGTSVKNLKPVR